MSELEVFNFRGNDVRVITVDGDPWWVARDVCALLGIDTSNLARTLDGDERRTVPFSLVSASPSSERPGLDAGRTAYIINEPGLYSLILRSRKPEAHDFKRWITHDVLPSIRKTGGYGHAQPAELTREQILTMALEAEREKNTAVAELEAAEPKIAAYDSFMDDDELLCYRDAARLLKNNGFDLAEREFIDMLRGWGMVEKWGLAGCVAHVNTGRIKNRVIRLANGTNPIQGRLTKSGLDYIIRKIRGGGDARHIRSVKVA